MGLGYGKDDIYPLAGSLELLHAATLLHDDILDDADLRRGVEASHLVSRYHRKLSLPETYCWHWLTKSVLTTANHASVPCLLPVLWLLSKARSFEIAHISEPLMNRDTYMDIIIGKTARLIETSCRLGAILASDDRTMEDAVGNFGLNMGIAFQLVDDALDYESPSDDTGKPEGGDLREGKITLPLILYLEMLQEKEAELLLAEIKNRTLSDEKRDHVLAEIRKHGLGTRTRTYAAEYVEKAKSCLDPLPEGEEKQVLKQAADFVLTRKKIGETKGEELYL